MKRTLVFPVLLILLCGTTAFADYDTGKKAHQNRDYETALAEIKPLAEQGHAKAQSLLGSMYGNGLGVTLNYKTAVKWYRLAADQGDSSGQHNLGFMYQNGLGVTRDNETAFKWYKLAAEQATVEPGAAYSQYNLGIMYFTGNGVTKNFIRAHMWWDIAASLGVEHAAKFRDEIEIEMTPSQLEKAQFLARECLERKFKDC